MSHEITIRKTGKAEMAYVGETPWHGLGQELQAGQSLETWREAAGMDWRIQRGLVRYATQNDGDLGLQVMPDQHVLFRSDTKESLGIVSPKYKVVQPSDVLEFFRDLTEANGFQLSTAGTLFNGKRFWALASIGEEACVVGDDKIGGFLLLSSSCDGTLATTAKFTTVRVVCQNTLSMAMNSRDRTEVSIRHTSKFDPERVKNELGLARGHFGDFMKAARTLAKKSMDNKKAAEFTASILTETKTVLGEDVYKSKQFLKIMDLFKGSAMGGTLLSAEGSAWGLVNSITEFVDHHARASTASHRMASAWYGRGDSLKTAALQKALSL
jgi:phage/plasmid-like protein (TIGR03299 family)